METNEAAAALLNMESPNNILDEKRMSKLFNFHLTLNMRHILYGVFTVCLCFFISSFCIVHTYGTLLESDLTYAPLRPDQMDNGALDMSLDEDTSSMDEIPQKCPLKPQKKTKGNTAVLVVTTQELSLLLYSVL